MKSLEAHSCMWQTVMKSEPSMIPVCSWAQVRHQRRDSHSAFLHIILLRRACLFLCQVTCRKRLKQSSDEEKGNSWNFAFLRSLPSGVFSLVLFHKEGGQRGARCVCFFFHTHWNSHMSNGLLNTSTGLRMERFFSTRYWRHCVPDTLTYLAELNRLKLTGHPASLKIFHIVSASLSLFTNISNQHCSVATINSRRAEKVFNSIPIGLL